MNSKSTLLAVPVKHSMHQLEGQALKKWWQLNGFFATKRKPETLYTNHALRYVLGLLMIIPFYGIVSSSAHHIQGIEQTKFIAMLISLWIASFAALMVFFRRHQHLILKAQVTEYGLELESLWFKRRLRWLEIADFFQTGNNLVGYNEWILDCTNGDQFILSTDLTESEKLIESLRRNIPAAPHSYQSSYRISDGLFDAASLAVFAVFLALFSGLLRWLITNPTISLDAVVANLAIPGALALVVLAYWRMHNTKVPQLVRIAPSGIFLRTRSAGHFIRWNQITKIVNIRSLTIIKSRSGWFVTFADQEEAAIKQLIEHKRSLPMI